MPLFNFHLCNTAVSCNDISENFKSNFFFINQVGGAASWTRYSMKIKHIKVLMAASLHHDTCWSTALLWLQLSQQRLLPPLPPLVEREIMAALTVKLLVLLFHSPWSIWLVWAVEWERAPRVPVRRSALQHTTISAISRLNFSIA